MTKIKNNYNPIPLEIEKKIYEKTLDVKFPFVVLTSKQMDYFNNEIKNNEIFKKYDINIETIKSLKNSYVVDLVIKNTWKIKQNIKKIKKKYEKNINILSLSNHYKFPPLALLKLILNVTNNYFLLRQYETSTPWNILNSKMAIVYDDYTIINTEKQLERANKFEEEIERILKKNNLQFKTQNELVEEQNKKYGRSINTPDFLLLNDSSEYKWIDAKNFYGACTNFVITKIVKQINKYINTYGKGIIVFSKGFCSEIIQHLDDNVKCIHVKQLE